MLNKGMMEKKIIIILFVILYFSTYVFAETITLKSGKEIEGSIVERTEEYVKVDIGGVVVTYYSKNIERVDSQAKIKTKALLEERKSNTYINEKYKISMTGPDGWYMVADDELDKIAGVSPSHLDPLVVFSKYPVGTTTEAKIDITLVVEFLDPQVYPIKNAIGYLSVMEKTSSYPDRSISPIIEVNVNGIVGASSEYIMYLGFAQQSHTLQYAFTKDNYGFLISANTGVDVFEENKRILKESIESFRFLNE